VNLANIYCMDFPPPKKGLGTIFYGDDHNSVLPVTGGSQKSVNVHWWTSPCHG